VTQPDSYGTLTLRSSDPSVPPEVDNNFLAEPTDRKRPFEAVRATRRLARSPAFAAVTAGVILPGDAVDDDGLEAAVETALALSSHTTSTAPMGTHDDPWAVLDVLGAVRGVKGLRVVDTSILPRVPSTATNVTTIMIAEHITRRAYTATDGATTNAYSSGGPTAD
jgi:choline dehydrogenase